MTRSSPARGWRLTHSLYINSSYLLFSWISLSALGFLFWTICTHLYTAEQVGLATALLAALNLVTVLSLAGLEVSIVRFLPNREDKSSLLIACLLTPAVLALIVAILFILLQPVIAPGLSIVRANPAFVLVFVIFASVSTSSYILDSTFIAYRQSKYVFRKNLIFSFVKIALPAILVSLGAFGIYTSWMIGILVCVIYSLVILKTRFFHSFAHLSFISPIRGIMRYSLGNYVAAVFEGLPIIVLPFMIVYLFGATANAHYYISMMIANVLFIVAVAASQSLFAEGSHSSERLRAETIRAGKYVALVVAPGVALVFALGPRILAIFGPGYAKDGLGVLYFFAGSAGFVALNFMARTILKLQYRTTALMVIDGALALSIIGFTYLLRGHGLDGVGLAWLLGQGIILACFAAVLLRRRSV